MAKTRVASHKGNGTAKLRSAVTTADSATLSDGNFDPTTATACANWFRVAIYPRFTGGTAPTVTIQILVRGNIADGTGYWAVLPNKTAALTEGVIAIIEVGSRDVFFRVDAITGSPTSVDIWGTGWEQVDRQYAFPDK